VVVGKSLRRKLSDKEVRFLKVVLWGCTFVWMIMFTIFSVIMASWSSGEIENHMHGTKGDILEWLVPIWIVFSALLTDSFMARFVNRKFRGLENIEIEE